MFRLHLLRIPHVLFCGGQAGASAVLPAVQFEAVVPHVPAIPQRHDQSPVVSLRATSLRHPSDTKPACPLLSRPAPSAESASPQAWRLLGRDFRPTPGGSSDCLARISRSLSPLLILQAPGIKTHRLNAPRPVPLLRHDDFVFAGWPVLLVHWPVSQQNRVGIGFQRPRFLEVEFVRPGIERSIFGARYLRKG